MQEFNRTHRDLLEAWRSAHRRLQEATHDRERAEQSEKAAAELEKAARSALSVLLGDGNGPAHIHLGHGLVICLTRYDEKSSIQARVIAAFDASRV